VTRLRFVQDHHGEFDFNRMCMLVGVPRSSFYAWKNQVPSQRQLADRDLLKLITEIYQRSRPHPMGCHACSASCNWPAIDQPKPESLD
jgi:hypothetical protein